MQIVVDVVSCKSSQYQNNRKVYNHRAAGGAAPTHANNRPPPVPTASHPGSCSAECAEELTAVVTAVSVTTREDAVEVEVMQHDSEKDAPRDVD